MDHANAVERVCLAIAVTDLLTQRERLLVIP